MDNTETNRNRNSEKTKLSRAKTIKEKKSTKNAFPQQNGMDNNPVTIYLDKYNKPIIDAKNNSNNPIIVNQREPTLTNFTVEPVQIICPYCKSDIISEVEESFNCCTCLFMLAVIILCAIPCLCISGLCNSNSGFVFGDCNCSCNCCCDATHKCPKCKKVIGVHDSFPSGCC